MDYRESTFKAKFQSAAKILNVSPNKIWSLKVRDSVGSYREYDLLMDMLEREAHILKSQADGNLQGKGYLLQHGKNQIIIVSHETGLEILYVAGSIASIIGLIPLVLKCWSYLQGGRGQRNFHNIETRHFDEKGHLVEEHESGLFDDVHSSFGLMSGLVASAVEDIDGDLRQLRANIQDLTVRVETLENTQRRKEKPAGTEVTRKKRRGTT